VAYSQRRLGKSPRLETMLTPGEVAAMPGAPNSAVPMTRAMSLGAGRAILIREPRRSYIAEPGAIGIRPEPAPAILRRYGGQTRRAPGRWRMWRSARVLGSRYIFS
jgi:hypothetical protein